MYWFYQNPLTAALKQTWARPPATRTVWIHWIHAAGGASGSITMVVVFDGCLCCCGWTRDVTSSSYVKKGTKITLRLGLRRNILAHPCMHHTNCSDWLQFFMGDITKVGKVGEVQGKQQQRSTGASEFERLWETVISTWLDYSKGNKFL